MWQLVFFVKCNLFQCKCFPLIQKIPSSCYNNKSISTNICTVRCTVCSNTQIKEDSYIIISYGNYKVRTKWYQSYFLRGKYTQISSFHFYFNPRDVKCFFQFDLNLLEKKQDHFLVFHCCCYPVLVMMSGCFLALWLFIPGDKEVLLLSFGRGITESHRAREICFRFHQKFVGKQDFQASPALLLPASPVCWEHEGSKVPLQFLLTAQAELIQLPPSSSTHSLLLLHTVHTHFHNIALLKPLLPPQQ